MKSPNTYCTMTECAMFYLDCCRALTDEKLEELKKSKAEIEVSLEVPECFEPENPTFDHEC